MTHTPPFFTSPVPLGPEGLGQLCTASHPSYLLLSQNQTGPFVNGDDGAGILGPMVNEPPD
ncbi:MAG: hypothetical protein CMJ20_09040 [Phycisphaeraceae bacterium]|nr:hypothetical protein [Phycisphaeraceae bacterium]